MVQATGQGAGDLHCEGSRFEIAVMRKRAPAFHVER
jgi:hypothetical protein